MSAKNFIPTIWHDTVFTEYEKATVFASLANRSFERDIRGFGDRVKINSIADFSAGAYTPGSVTYQSVNATAMFLDIDQRDIVPVQMDNIDEAQSSPKLFSEMTRKMGYAMRDRIDQALAAKYTEATSVSGTTGSPTSVTSATINSLVGLASVAMSDHSVPEEGRVAVVPNWLAEKMRLGRIVRDTQNPAYLSMPSYVGQLGGFEVFKSNNVAKSGTTWYAPLFFTAGDTIAFAEQLEMMEAIKDKDYPSYDFMNLITVYGLKVVRPESLFTMYVANGAETAI